MLPDESSPLHFAVGYRFGMLIMRIIFVIYVAQATVGLAVGFVLPWFW
jgi:hypothetical protein